VIPAVVVSALIFLVGDLFDLPVIGGLVGTGVLVVILVYSLPLLVRPSAARSRLRWPSAKDRRILTRRKVRKEQG
jgi:hypothetical protein